MKTESETDFFPARSKTLVRSRREENPPYPAEIEEIRRLSYGLRGFRKFCGLLTLEDGSRFKVSPWEAFVLAFYFAGVLELVIILPKKNGKTTLLAALALYHLLMTPSAEVVVGASSGKQANILRRQAELMVRRSALHRRPVEGQDRHERTRYEGVFELRGGSWEIRFELGRIVVLAADADTADGVIPTLALVDELHRHPNGDLYGVFRDGLGPRNGQIITISTPGSTEDSPLGELRRTAMEDFERQTEGKRRVYEGPNFVLVEWGLEEGDDPQDLRLVKMANPAPWQTPEKLRQRRDSPSMRAQPWQWRRFGAGMWTTAEEAVIPEEVWDALGADLGGVADGDTVSIAVRITQQGGCGIGIAAIKDEDRIAVQCMMLDYNFPGLEFKLRQLAETYDVRVIYGYAPQFGIGAQVIEDGGLPMEDLAQSPMRLMEATSTFLTLVASKRLIHDGDRVLRKQVLSARIKEAPTGSYFKPTKEIQGLVAVILAADQASQYSPRPMVLIPSGGVG